VQSSLQYTSKFLRDNDTTVTMGKDKVELQRQKEKRALQELPVPTLRVNNEDMETDEETNTPVQARHSKILPIRQEWLRENSRPSNYDGSQGAGRVGANIPSMFTQSHGAVSNQLPPSGSTDYYLSTQSNQRVSTQRISNENVPSMFSQVVECGSAQLEPCSTMEYSSSAQDNRQPSAQGHGTDNLSFWSSQGTRHNPTQPRPSSSIEYSLSTQRFDSVHGYPSSGANIPSMFSGANGSGSVQLDSYYSSFTHGNQQVSILPSNGANIPSVFARAISSNSVQLGSSHSMNYYSSPHGSQHGSVQPSSGASIPSMFTQNYRDVSAQPSSFGSIDHAISTQGSQRVELRLVNDKNDPAIIARGNRRTPLNYENVYPIFSQNNRYAPLNDENDPSIVARGNRRAPLDHENVPSIFNQNDRSSPLNDENDPSIIARGNRCSTTNNENVSSMFAGNNGRSSSQPGLPSFTDQSIIAQGNRRPLGEIKSSTATEQSKSESNDQLASDLLHPSSARRNPSMPTQGERTSLDRLHPLPPHRLHPSSTAAIHHTSSAAAARLNPSVAAQMLPPPPPMPSGPYFENAIPNVPNGRMLFVRDSVELPTQALNLAYHDGEPADRFRRQFSDPVDRFKHPFAHPMSVEQACLALQGFLTERDVVLANNTNADIENSPPTPRASDINRGTGVGLGLNIGSGSSGATSGHPHQGGLTIRRAAALAPIDTTGGWEIKTEWVEREEDEEMED
jgi:hypothetical protein